jgi:pimeloyl-ACP methyl ester carboxylesterase
MTSSRETGQMSSQEPNPEQSNLELFYTRHTPPPRPNDKDPSHAPIVFLHGHESCQLEFSRTIPFLSQDYELILVDLPGHSQSKDKVDFTLDNAVNALSHLVSTHVAGGKVHIVGLSLGGFIGLEFARRCPELVLSLFCTGCAPFSGSRRWIRSQTLLLSSAIIVLGSLATESMFWYSLGLEPIPGLREEFKKNQNMGLLRAGFAAATSVTLEHLAEIRGVRIAIVAGEKLDGIEETREAGKVLGSSNPECKAYVVRDAIHLWDLQFPELFAQGVRAWVDGSEMPKEFEVLN